MVPPVLSGGAARPPPAPRAACPARARSRPRSPLAQFRDLAHEAEALHLETRAPDTYRALEAWEIPQSRRRRQLVKNAPVPPRPPTLMTSVIDAVTLKRLRQ